MENENVKKNNTVVVILLVAILMVLCLLGGYFLSESGVFKANKEDSQQSSEKNDKNSSEDNSEKEPVVTNYEPTDEKVEKLISNLLKGSFTYSGCRGLEIFTNDTKVEAKDLNDLTIYHIVEANEFYNNRNSFTIDEMNAAVKKYFGDAVTFNPTAVDYNSETCPQYSYDSNTKVFTKKHTGCGGTCGPATQYKIVKAVDTDGVLKLDVKVVFSGAGSRKDGYYSDYQLNNYVCSFQDDVNNMLDKGSDYQFTFKMIDNYYAFVSSEPMN